jgi:hypothetical protein
MFDRVTTRRASISGLLACAGLSACAPVFSDLQSARLVGRDRVEVTASASRVSVSSEELDDGDDIDVTDQFGVQVATGLTDWMDARLRFERVELKDAGGDEVGGVNVLGLGPKFQIVKDRVAAYLPVGLAFGEDVDASETWQFHPTLLLTLPAHRNVEMNASAKCLIPLRGELDNVVAFNFGLGLGRLESWAIRPEVGFLINPGESGHFTHFSLGVSFRAR